ncbi:MAG TPA: TIGR02996 domain-containing protein [Gemmataceae bacterium]|nr:TIGR02996 domain-containing protein [Gemmataceae bacterium]
MAHEPDDPFWRIEMITDLAPDAKSIPAAREVLKKGGFGTVEATADGRGWWVVCEGITDTYQVSVRREAAAAEPACECTCPSPKYPCKHALALLLYLSEHPELRVEKEETRRAPGDFDALLRAVLANPDDDTPRLIFADFLDENDQPDRAALIRVQCEKHHLKPASKRFKELAKEEADLTERIEAMIGPLPENYGSEFERGFLKVRAHADYNMQDVNSLPARFVELFRAGWVETVVLQTYGHLNPAQLSLFKLAGQLDVSQTPLREEGLLILAADASVGAEGARLARVKVHPTDEPIYRVFTSSDPTARLPRTPRLHGPQGPQRRYNGVTTAQLGLLLRAGRFDGVEVLYLDGPIGDAGAALLADTDDLRKMHALTLTNSGLTAEGARGLVALGHFPSMRELTLFHATTGPGAFTAMVEGSGLANLTGLHLQSERVGDAGVLALANATHFTNLETIRLMETGATPAAVAALLASEHLPELQELHLMGEDLTPSVCARLALDARDRPHLLVTCDGVQVTRNVLPNGDIRLRAEGEPRRSPDAVGDLGASPVTHRIAALEMRDVGLGAAAIAPLAAGLSPSRLKELDLSDNSLGNDGAAALATAFRDFRPEVLVLSRNVIRKTGAIALSNSPLLSGVRVLDVSHNNIGYNGVSAIIHSPHLGPLKELRLQGTNLTLNEWKEVEKKVGKKVLM